MQIQYVVDNQTFTDREAAEKYEKKLEAEKTEKAAREAEKKELWKKISEAKKAYETLVNEYYDKYSSKNNKTCENLIEEWFVDKFLW